MARLFAAGALFAGLLVAGCQTAGTGTGGAGSQALLQGTNAPASGFQEVVAGSEEDFIMNVGRRIYFTEGSAVLDDTSKVTLDQQAAWLNRYPNWLLKVQGFSDDPGSPADNIAISQKRAEAVMAYLVSRGVAPGRMWAKGYGRDRVVRDCQELACKSQNRRVISNLREEFDAAAPQSAS